MGGGWSGAWAASVLTWCRCCSARARSQHSPASPRPTPAPQLCVGFALPVWAGALTEADARAAFAAAHVADLQPAEKKWAVSAFVGYEWWALLWQLPALGLIAWHVLLAGATVLARLGCGG